MREICRFASLVVCCLLVLACSHADMMNKIVDAQHVDKARAIIFDLNSGNIAGTAERIDPTLKTADLESRLTEVAGLIPDVAPLSEQVVGYQVNEINGVTIRNITFEWQYADGWLLANAAVKESGEQWTIIGISAQPTTQSLTEANKFSISDKPVRHYVMLGALLFVLGLIAYSLYLCIKTSIPKRKWLWILFIVFGVGRFSIEWTSGAINFTPLSLLLFGGSAVAPLFGSWVVSVALPIGAVVFLLKRKRWLATDA